MTCLMHNPWKRTFMLVPLTPFNMFSPKRKLIYCNVMCIIQALLLWFVQTTSLLICNLSLCRTPSFFLGLCFPKQISHCPMCAIPNLNIMVERAPWVILRVGATNRREGRLQGKMYVHNQYIYNIALFMLQSW
jgi:hypothetical protein